MLGNWNEIYVTCEFEFFSDCAVLFNAPVHSTHMCFNRMLKPNKALGDGETCVGRGLSFNAPFSILKLYVNVI